MDTPPTIHITGDREADALLSRDPLALLTAMLLEGRSVPLGPSGWIDLPRDLAQFADAAVPIPHRTTLSGDFA